MSTVIHLINRSPTHALQDKTAYEIMYGRASSVKHLRVFGCIAFTLIPSHKLQKLDEKSEKCIFVGYSCESKAYRLYNPVSCRIIISYDVVFHEESRWSWEASHEGVPTVTFEE